MNNVDLPWNNMHKHNGEYWFPYEHKTWPGGLAFLSHFWIVHSSKLMFVEFLHTFLICSAAFLWMSSFGLVFRFKCLLAHLWWRLLFTRLAPFIGPLFWIWIPSFCLEVCGLLVQQVLLPLLLFLYGRHCIYIWMVLISFLSFSHGCYRGSKWPWQHNKGLSGGRLIDSSEVHDHSPYMSPVIIANMQFQNIALVQSWGEGLRPSSVAASSLGPSSPSGFSTNESSEGLLTWKTSCIPEDSISLFTVESRVRGSNI